ncbi:uncharacterized protein E5676_scaffold16G001340 [Cucumis melo var. makuwa]|uniref:DUF7642 domain-containing protein n=1 Tax=Cucumis melo var. makuwa TaxID=1194695 RepID=A0A5D3CDR0_CUCMM|nr:uncharacterized protein E5676_scaffold16G001340 [Cucumis melo var. makuwa]
MGSDEEVVEISSLERGLLSECSSDLEPESDDEPVLFAASFQEMEDNFVKYHTAQWVLYSFLLILAWGIGLLMLLYLPVRRYILRKDLQSKRLYLTPNSIVYKVTRPVPFPCFGVLKKEKHVLLPSVADIIIEQVGNDDQTIGNMLGRQASSWCGWNLGVVFIISSWMVHVVGYLESLYGVYSIRIENAGVRRPPGDDVHIQGVADPIAFRKVAVLMRLADMRDDGKTSQISTIEEVLNTKASPSKSLKYDPYLYSGEQVLQKVDEVGSSVKRVQALIEEQRSQVSNILD